MTNNESLALLEALADCAPSLQLERTLFADTNNRLRSVISMDAFKSLIQTMKEKRRVRLVASEDGNKYGITDEGIARLHELQGR